MRDTVTGSGGTIALSNANALVTGVDAIAFSGADVLTLEQTSSGTLSGFAQGDAIALSSLPYKSSYEAAYYASASGGTLEILDTANGNAVAAALPFSGSLAGEAFTLSADPVAGTDVTLSAASWANPQAGDVLFTNVPGQAYSAYQYDYTAGSLVGSQFYYTAIAGQPYTAEEIDYNGGGQLTRAAFSGVTGQPYSAYEYNYVGGRPRPYVKVRLFLQTTGGRCNAWPPIRSTASPLRLVHVVFGLSVAPRVWAIPRGCAPY